MIMDLYTIKLLLAAAIVISFISTSHSFDHNKPGVCAKPCTGGVNDLCLDCASNCVGTCANPTGYVPGEDCNHMCRVNECHCANGYVRAPDNQCVLPQQCPQVQPIPHSHQLLPPTWPGLVPLKPQCPVCTGGDHDHCVECGSTCPRTCGQPKDQVCATVCKPNVCQCDVGYARAPNGKCVLETQCPLIDPIRPPVLPPPASSPPAIQHPLFRSPTPLPPTSFPSTIQHPLFPPPTPLPHINQHPLLPPTTPSPPVTQHPLPPLSKPLPPINQYPLLPPTTPLPPTVKHPISLIPKPLPPVIQHPPSPSPAPLPPTFHHPLLPAPAPLPPTTHYSVSSFAAASSSATSSPSSIKHPLYLPLKPSGPNCPVCTGGIHDRCRSCGSACPRTCGLPDDRVCTRECRVNVCQCDEGYYRSPNGQCVEKSQCPHTEPNHPVYPTPKPSGPSCPVCTGGIHDRCRSCGSACPPTCGLSNDRVCTKQCVVNVCQCDEGYKRASNGTCIPDSQCPQPYQTHPHPVPVSLWKPSAPTFSHGLYSPQIEPIRRRPHSGGAPLQPACPVCTGGRYDHCVECGSSCPPTCGQPKDQACATVCKPYVCQCDEGYARSQNGTCILESHCLLIKPIRPRPYSGEVILDPECPVCTGGDNDNCVSCGSSCPSVCGAPKDRFCTLECRVNVCECDEGYARAPNGICIPEYLCYDSDEVSEELECPVCTGGYHDHCVECGSSCPLTCGEPKDQVCATVCQPSVCQCDSGYARAYNGTCIPAHLCPEEDLIGSESTIDELSDPYPDSSEVIDPKSLDEDVVWDPDCPVCTGGEYDSCVSCGSFCPNTCGESKDRFCTEECRVNVCECDEGYARAPDGKCVPEDECPIIDPIYPDPDSEEVSSEPECPVCTGGVHDSCVECGSSCPLTCDEPPDVCTAVCKVNVCECDEGFVRGPTGKCIKRSHCPRTVDAW